MKIIKDFAFVLVWMVLYASMSYLLYRDGSGEVHPWQHNLVIFFLIIYEIVLLLGIFSSILLGTKTQAMLDSLKESRSSFLLTKTTGDRKKLISLAQQSVLDNPPHKFLSVAVLVFVSLSFVVFVSGLVFDGYIITAVLFLVLYGFYIFCGKFIENVFAEISQVLKVIDMEE